MLVITNGSIELTVTKGAYNSLYKHQGFEIKGAGVHTPPPEIEERKTSQAEIAVEGPEDEAVLDTSELPIEETEAENSTKSDAYEDEEEERELSEIPLAEMTKSQLIAYAEELGIELDGDETKRALRVAIRKALN